MSTNSILARDISSGEATASLDPEVARLAAQIDFNSPLSIQQFGSEIADRSAHYTDEILTAARAIDLGETGSQLNEIVVAAKKFDLESLNSALGRTPIFGGLLKRASLSKEKATAKFDSVKAQVEKLVSQVEATAELLNRRNRDYQSMYIGVREEHELLGKHVEALELRLVDLEGELSTLAHEAETLEVNERIAVLEATRNQMGKRADDLKVLQHAAMQTLPMVRIIQSNNLALVDKFQTIRQLTLPAWKRSFMLALTLDEQKNAVALASTIDDATNALMRRNAELLRQNSVATAKSNQRLVVDVETLREVHEKILLTLTDVRREHQEGAAQRRAAIGELERLRVEMADGVRAIGLVNG